MTSSARYQQAREALARRLRLRFGNQAAEDAPFSPTAKAFWFPEADALLSLKGKDGKPYLAVVSADQRLPALGPETSGAALLTYLQHAQLLSAAGFVKVEKP